MKYVDDRDNERPSSMSLAGAEHEEHQLYGQRRELGMRQISGYRPVVPKNRLSSASRYYLIKLFSL